MQEKGEGLCASRFPRHEKEVQEKVGKRKGMTKNATETVPSKKKYVSTKIKIKKGEGKSSDKKKAARGEKEKSYPEEGNVRIAEQRRGSPGPIKSGGRAQGDKKRSDVTVCEKSSGFLKSIITSKKLRKRSAKRKTR